ncbi:type II toxin-antitoxin system ParD family antitoxin [Microvirga arabica]|uniref:Type II toxin-antitoxin system ParD family antitoxin n=1 Tax=Microvirga arabica TaxID=1128671 RepID=A0ABV6YB04_9HYPH
MPDTPKSLNVSLTPELTRFITARVASGRYQTASEVVRAALRLLEREEAGLLPGRAAKQPRPKTGPTANE